MLKQSMLTCGKALGLLLVVYLPAFMIVSVVVMSLTTSGSSDAEMMTVAFPLVIGISLVIAVIVIAIFGGRQFRTYGFRLVSGRTLLSSLGVGAVVGFALRWLSWALGVQEPAMFTGVATWQIILFLWAGAPIQEEIIFRGVFQTTLEQGIPEVVTVGRWRLSVAAAGAAVAFALVHLSLLSVGASWGTVAFIGVSALLLGVLAGQFRWHSGSLIPGILIHALFNVAGSVWP